MNQAGVLFKGTQPANAAVVCERDILTKSVTFLQKRDGIDKVLKIIRYTAKLACLSAFKDSDTDLANQLRGFESSIGVTRKALKLGKWLANVDELRHVARSQHLWALEVLSGGGEVVYLFLEQIQWLIKAGLIAKRFSPRVTKVSAWAELVGYSGSIALSIIQVTHCLQAEASLEARLRRSTSTTLIEGVAHLSQADDDEKKAKQLHNQLERIRSRRKLKQLSMLQDFADAAIALNDIRGGRGRLSNPIMLSLMGLLSAAISAHKNWPE